ncbi:MAG: site-2 protease family protein, partial [Deltaproteobacteria bacterium]|nr:site-2 protease family protein [Deltaproteobacteria bacterium]
MLVTLVSFAFVLGVLVFAHELGHFLVARACG